MALRLFQIFFGTSSRMRGKRGARRLSEAPGRNIPAYAGKTLLPQIGVMSQKEHPRIRGENASLPTMPTTALGNIPAYAGKTVRLRLGLWFEREHPRIRGENKPC